MKTVRTLLLVIGFGLMTAPVHADLFGEREALTRLVHELKAMEPIIDEAEAQANHDFRVRFRYDWLRQDLLRIRLGIQEHVNAPRAQPRAVEPLRGDYRH